MNWPWSKPPRTPLALQDLVEKYGDWTYENFCKYAPMEDLGDYIDGLEAVRAAKKRELENT